MSKSRIESDKRSRAWDAHRPQGIPKSGWRGIALDVKEEIANDNLSIVAAGVAFYAFLAVFPALAALVSIYGLVVTPATVENHLTAIGDFLPAEAAPMVQTQLRRITDQQQSQLGWALLGSVVLALWSASKGMKAMFEAMNITYDEDERRGFFKLNGLAVLMTFAAVVLVLVFLALIAVLPALVGILPVSDTLGGFLRYLRWPVVAMVGLFSLAALYRYGPSREHPEWKWLSWGAAIAILLWLIGSSLFSLYVSSFGSYDKTYGSLGVVVVLMMWLFVSVYTILIGSEVNAVIERRAAQRTRSAGPQTARSS